MNKLEELAEQTNKTQKEIIQAAIDYFDEKKDIIDERIKDIKENGEEALLDLEKILKERLNK